MVTDKILILRPWYVILPLFIIQSCILFNQRCEIKFKFAVLSLVHCWYRNLHVFNCFFIKILNNLFWREYICSKSSLIVVSKIIGVVVIISLVIRSKSTWFIYKMIWACTKSQTVIFIVWRIDQSYLRSWTHIKRCHAWFFQHLLSTRQSFNVINEIHYICYIIGMCYLFPMMKTCFVCN